MKLFTRSTNIYLLFLSTCMLGTIKLHAQTNSGNISAIKNTSARYTYKIIESKNNTFGYDIYANEKMLIHQPSVPGMAGNEGFKTKTGAEKVTRLVILKIQKGEMPPTISVSEMKKLKVI